MLSSKAQALRGYTVSQSYFVAEREAQQAWHYVPQALISCLHYQNSNEMDFSSFHLI